MPGHCLIVLVHGVLRIGRIVLVPILGKMVTNTLGNIRMEKVMVRVPLPGEMVINTLENIKMAKGMVREDILMQMEQIK